MKVSGKMTKVFAVLMMAVMIVGVIKTTNAKAEVNYIVPANPTGRYDFQAEPGEMRHVVLPVKLSETGMDLTVFSLYAEADTPDIQIMNVKLINPRVTSEVADSSGLVFRSGQLYNLEFDIAVSDSIKIGYHSISVKGNGQLWSYGAAEREDLNNSLLMTLTSYTVTELKPIEIVVDKLTFDDKLVYPGSSFTMQLKLKNAGEIQALNTYLTMDFGDSGLIADYNVESIKIGTLKAGETTTVDIPVKVLKNAEPKFCSISANITCKDNSGTSVGPFVQNMYLTVLKPDEEKVKTESPVLELSTPDNYKVLQPDTEDVINVTVKNTGAVDAYDAKIAVVSGFDTSAGITKGYTTDSISVGNIKAGKSKDIQIPVRIAKGFAAGLYEIKMNASYKDEKENALTSAEMTMYVKGSATEQTSKNGVSIGNVAQSPSYPVAGDKVTVSFDIVNEGTSDITNVKAAGTGLSSSGFEPVSSEPYKKVGTVKAGSKTRVSMTFKVGKDIPSGFNTLNISCEYTNADGTVGTESAGLYILNIVNDKKTDTGEQKTSRPKLIINRYSAEPVIDPDTIGEDEDIEKLKKELKAGREFDFKYSIKNTHATKVAKNIKITLEQAEGIFIPVDGSNIFYIDSIDAGETSEQVVRMRTRSDVATGDYNIAIKVEYEYDDMSEADKEKGGVVDENNIKLRAIENYRPEIENISIDAYDGVMMGQPVDLSFEFYNMGKSTLGNVYITIEGDFALANNSSKTYVGAVNGYSQEYVNPQIVPLVPGEATGTIVVHFEDSNGDEQIKTADFSTFVMDSGDYGDYGDYGDMSDGFYNPDFPDGYEDSEFDPEGMDGEEGTKILGLPLWLFITICASVVVIAVVVIVIVVKKKHKKALLDEDDE